VASNDCIVETAAPSGNTLSGMRLIALNKLAVDSGFWRSSLLTFDLRGCARGAQAAARMSDDSKKNRRCDELRRTLVCHKVRGGQAGRASPCTKVAGSVRRQPSAAGSNLGRRVGCPARRGAACRNRPRGDEHGAATGGANPQNRSRPKVYAIAWTPAPRPVSLGVCPPAAGAGRPPV
jgi:hypothetical protein